MRSFARIAGAALFGARARLIDVQVSVAGEDEGGERAFRIVGLPDSALREGRERIRGAVVHGGWPWPHPPITVNLAPAAARKEGAALDLPIALGVLAAQGLLAPHRKLRTWLCLGELGLDGSVRPVRGVLAAAEAALGAGLGRALVPRANVDEAAAVVGLEAFGIATLADAVGHLSGRCPLEATAPRPWSAAPVSADDLAGLRGQPAALRAAIVAAAGGHNLFMSGPPGAGKTLLAHRLRTLLPPLEYEEAVEVSRIHSIAGRLESGLVTRRPFRAPHHTTSLAGLVGGGSLPRPGEVSLAHLGVLFLDELAEFPRPSLEALRQPLEDGRLVIGRAAGRAAFPAEVLLVAATNPCPCGWHGVEGRCRCTRRSVARYRARISGPLRDRFDLRIRLGPVDPAALVAEAPAELPACAGIGARKRAARAQWHRARRYGLRRPLNARLPPVLLPAAVAPTREAERELV
ncbi:MAG: YifB family Mg chelatase-like AAA ATPase, partial [Planctomycetota bacterium]